jgi:hypothetical protein
VIAASSVVGTGVDDDEPELLIEEELHIEPADDD